MTEFTLADSIPVGNTLGKAFYGMKKHTSTWWTDIHNARLYCCRLVDKKLEEFLNHKCHNKDRDLIAEIPC